MAKSTACIYSKALQRKVTVDVLIPSDFSNKKVFPSFYLLHGINGGKEDWTDCSNIQHLSHKYEIAVVAVDGENKFFTDNAQSGDMYGKFIGEELPELLSRTYAISPLRSDRYIGGLSMGGLGAVRNGLLYNNAFSKIAVMSAALFIDELADSFLAGNDKFYGYDMTFFQSVFGDLSVLLGSDNDYKAQALRIISEGGAMPDMLFCCGRDDFLYKSNCNFDKWLCENNISHTFLQTDGEHNWNYWRERLEDLFKFVCK